MLVLEVGLAWEWGASDKEALEFVEGTSFPHSYENYIAKLGDHRLRPPSSNSILVPVRDIVLHEDFDSSLRNDIALILLAFPVNFTAHIQPVCLPEKQMEVEKGTVCWVTGWGRLGTNCENLGHAAEGRGLVAGMALQFQAGERGPYVSRWVVEQKLPRVPCGW